MAGGTLPAGQRFGVHAGLLVVQRQQLRPAGAQAAELRLQHRRNRGVQAAAVTLQQRLVSGIAHQGVLEAVVPLCHVGLHTQGLRTKRLPA